MPVPVPSPPSASSPVSFSHKVLQSHYELKAFLKLINQSPYDSDLFDQVDDIYYH
ncbi:MAG: hypothetical protein Homavirus25_6, partial [Homavirus sp.]